MMVLALIAILLQGVIVGLLLYFIRTFGQYTEVLQVVHRENLVLRKTLGRAMRPPIDIHEGLPEHEVKEVA